MMRTCGDPETETTSSARCDWSEDDENHGNHISQQVAYFTYRHIIYCLAPFFKVNSTLATILVSRWLISQTDILYNSLHHKSKLMQPLQPYYSADALFHTHTYYILSCNVVQGEFN